ncbi:hypothetical protein ABIA14_000795 [Sinorhizobium fredii]
MPDAVRQSLKFEKTLVQTMDQALFNRLCRAGKFKDALGLAIRGREHEKYTPSRFSMDKKSGLPIFYRGNKRVEADATGEWQLAKNTKL